MLLTHHFTYLMVLLIILYYLPPLTTEFMEPNANVVIKFNCPHIVTVEVLAAEIIFF